MALLDDAGRLRRIMLWVMLGALGASGLMAVVGVLGNDIDQAWKMIGSGIDAVVAAGLMLAVCKLLDSEKMRKTGLFVLGMILVEFILVLLAFWDPLRNWMVRDSNERQALTALLFAVVAIPAIVFFHVRQLRGGALSGFLGMVCCAAAYAFFLYAIWSGAWMGDSEKTFETGWGIWFFGFGSAANCAGAGTDRRHWRWVGLAASVVVLVVGIQEIVSDTNQFSNLFIASATLGILIGHANIVFLCKLKKRQEWLRLGTVASALFAGATFDYAAIGKGGLDVVWRVASAAGICAGCGTVAVAILAAFNRRPAPQGGDGIEATEIAVVCPNCRGKQVVGLERGIGESACAGCGMIFSVRMRAPRCAACGYLLLMFRGEACPECGARVGRNMGASVEAIEAAVGKESQG